MARRIRLPRKSEHVELGVLGAGAAFVGLSLLALAPGCEPADDGARPLPGVSATIGRQGKAPGRFVLPRSVAYDPRGGYLCVVDRTGRIQRFRDPSLAPRPVEAPAQPQREWLLVNSWTLPEYEVGFPTRIHYDEEGRLWVADTHYHRVRIYDPDDGRLLDSWGREGAGAGEFSQVRDVVRDASGNIYVGDYGSVSDRILKFDDSGKHTATIGRRGSGPGEFRRVQEIAVQRSADGTETLLVVDSCNHRLQRLSLEGEFMESWGELGTGAGQFRYPYGLALQDRPDGDVFVVEWGNNRVQRFDHQGRYLGQFGVPGREPGELATPWDIELSPDGRLFVADCNNHRVQVFRWPEDPEVAGGNS